jgi:hypothetical protein
LNPRAFRIMSQKNCQQGTTNHKACVSPFSLSQHQ